MRVTGGGGSGCYIEWAPVRRDGKTKILYGAFVKAKARATGGSNCRFGGGLGQMQHGDTHRFGDTPTEWWQHGLPVSDRLAGAWADGASCRDPGRASIQSRCRKDNARPLGGRGAELMTGYFMVARSSDLGFCVRHPQDALPVGGSGVVRAGRTDWGIWRGGLWQIAG